MTHARAAVNALIMTLAGTTLADDFSTRIDPGGDAFPRRADFGADGAISPAAVQISTSKKAKLTPTAKASMLVATANVSISLIL